MIISVCLLLIIVNGCCGVLGICDQGGFVWGGVYVIGCQFGYWMFFCSCCEYFVQRYECCFVCGGECLYCCLFFVEVVELCLLFFCYGEEEWFYEDQLWLVLCFDLIQEVVECCGEICFCCGVVVVEVLLYVVYVDVYGQQFWSGWYQFCVLLGGEVVGVVVGDVEVVDCGFCCDQFWCQE